MKYKRIGVVKSCETLETSFNGKTLNYIVLRPEAGWRYPIPISRKIMMILPDGRTYYPKVKGAEEMTADPGIAIEIIPEINNQVPNGTRIYVNNEDAEKWKRWAFLCKHGFGLLL